MTPDELKTWFWANTEPEDKVNHTATFAERKARVDVMAADILNRNNMPPYGGGMARLCLYGMYLSFAAGAYARGEISRQEFDEVMHEQLFNVWNCHIQLEGDMYAISVVMRSLAHSGAGAALELLLAAELAKE